MNKTGLTALLLGLVLINIVAPFSGLAALMLLIFVATLYWLGLTLVQALITGSSTQDNAFEKSEPRENSHS